MTDAGSPSDKHASPEEAQRQANALQPRVATGASIKHRYRNRTQEVFAVTRSDLEDIRAEGLSSALPFTVGMFMLSGSVWVAVDKYLSRPEGADLPSAFWVMLLAASFGATLICISIPFKIARKNKIDKILSDVLSD